MLVCVFCHPYSLTTLFQILPAIKNVREGTRSPRTAHEIGLKRSYDTMEGNIKQGMSMRESPVSAPLEGKTAPSKVSSVLSKPFVLIEEYLALFYGAD